MAEEGGPTITDQGEGEETTTPLAQLEQSPEHQQSSPPESAPAPTPQSSVDPTPAVETPQEKKAKEFIRQAEQKLKSASSFFGGLFGGGVSKREEAADLYVRAANSFKVAKRPKAAGDAFRRAAMIHMEMDTKHEAATNLTEAGQVLKRDVPEDSVKCYLQAVEIYTDMGRFSLAARFHSTVAEILETQLQKYDEAIGNYEQAADYYRGEDSVGSSNKCLLKVAHLSATLQRFDKAAEIFESVGRASLENTLLKYAAKEYFFKAALCHFCIGLQDAKDAVERYRQIHPAFEGTRELKLLLDLFEAVDEQEGDKFSEIVKEYDAISRIDAWLTAQLLHIKKAMTEEDRGGIL